MMVVKIVHKKSKKDYYVRDVVRVLITRLDSKTNPQEVYRLKRKYKNGEETVTDIQMFHSDEYYIGEVYEEEEWMND